jgi:hypothetical protein
MAAPEGKLADSLPELTVLQYQGVVSISANSYQINFEKE